MLNAIGNFKTAIKEISREVKIKITHTYNGTNYIIEGDDIIEVNYTSQAEKEQGSVVLKVVDAKLRVTDNTILLERDSIIQLTYVCDGECECDIMYVDYSKEKNNVITIQAYDLLTYLSNNSTVVMPLDRNVQLKEYMQKVFKSLSIKAFISDDIVSTNLSVAFSKSTSLLQTFKELAIASNSIIHFGQTGHYSAKLPLLLPQLLNQKIIGAEVNKMCFAVPTESIDSYISYTKIDDGSNKYNDVRIPIYSPNLTTDRKVGTMKCLIPQNVSGYCPGTVELEDTFIPSVIKINDIIEVDSITLCNNTCALSFNNNSALAKEIECELYGSSIENTSILYANTDNTNKIKVVNNMYIQSAAVYDSKIYKSNDIEISYFGNPLIEVGDTVSIDGMNVLVLEHTLKFTGGLKGTIKGAIEWN